MRINKRGLDLIKHFESLHDGDLSRIGAQPKMCPAGIWTVGYGRALRKANGSWFKGEKDRAAVYAMYPALTETDAETMLAIDLRVYERAVLDMIKRRDLNEDQFSALVSFCYNCGTHYTDKNKHKVPFAIWRNIDNRLSPEKLRAYWDSSVIKVGGAVLPGLVRRRKAEAHLYLTGTLKFQW